MRTMFFPPKQNLEKERVRKRDNTEKKKKKKIQSEREINVLDNNEKGEIKTERPTLKKSQTLRAQTKKHDIIGSKLPNTYRK